ncbi:AroM family protein [Streptomyces sp. NPDC021098]|uniref:AroM family protein n=1 Tax=unclassified Streptomyces TaxID=2593676 RepID=UPI00379A6F9B
MGERGQQPLRHRLVEAELGGDLHHAPLRALPVEGEQDVQHAVRRLERRCAGYRYASDGSAPEAVAAAARTLAARGSTWIVLDCIGYTERMRAAALRAAERPVLLARAIAIRMAAEVVAASP